MIQWDIIGRLKNLSIATDHSRVVIRGRLGLLGMSVMRPEVNITVAATTVAPVEFALDLRLEAGPPNRCCDVQC